MTDEEKIYIAYGETMHTFQLLELQFESVLVFLKLEQYENADSLWLDLSKWRRGPLRRMIDLAELPDVMTDLAVKLTYERNHFAHRFLREVVWEVQGDSELLGQALERLAKAKNLAETLMKILSAYTADMTEGYDWHEIQAKMNRGG